MKADARAIRALVGNDLRALLRSPRTLVVSVGLPLVVWPIMFLVMQWTQASQEERVDSTTFLYARADDRTDTLLDGLLEQVPSDDVRIEEVQASDPVILATAASAVLVMTLLAFLVPALRASRRAPVDDLLKG